MQSTKFLGTKKTQHILGCKMRAQRYAHTLIEKEAKLSARNTSTMGRFSCDSPSSPSPKKKKKNASGANGSWQCAQLAASTALD